MVEYTYFNITAGVYNVQKCQKYDHLFSIEMREKYAPLFKAAEEEYQCSGACIAENKYLFSNINK